jgi:HlyD family secretion protein
MGERHDVLMVPNAALRWTPQPEQIVPEFRQTGKKNGKEKKPSPEAGKEEQALGVVWVPQGSLVRPVVVTLGLSDGSSTEVENPELKEGTRVVVGKAEKPAGGAESAGSPFTPQLLRKSATPPK